MANRGQPPKFNKPSDMQKKIAAFWAYIEEKKKPATIERLCCFLECDRDTLLNYAKKDDYYELVKKTKLEILADKVERLNTIGTPTGGLIFDLINNYKYKNKTEVDNNLALKPSPLTPEQRKQISKEFGFE